MMHPHTELRFVSPEVGFGVVATRPIPRGTLTWVLDDLDQRLSTERISSLDPRLLAQLYSHGYRDLGGDTILLWDHGRFVNHSCDPTSGSGGDDTYTVALRDIAAGEQVSETYAEFFFQQSFPCRCGAANCCGEFRPEAQVSRRATLQRSALLALGVAAGVEQPLRDLARRHAPLAQALRCA